MADDLRRQAGAAAARQEPRAGVRQGRLGDARFLLVVSRGNRAIRVGDWKLVADQSVALGTLRPAHGSLRDPRTLRPQHPDKVKELDQAWTRHMEEFRALAQQDLPPDRAGKVAKPRKKPAR